MIKSILSSMVMTVFLSSFAASVYADQLAQVRQECNDEVAGYGIENPEEQKQAIADCVATRMEPAAAEPAAEEPGE